MDAVIEAAGEAGIPIRIGVNAGSLAAEYADLDWPLAEKLAASAVSFCEHFETRGFTDIVVSAKASSVPVTIEAYRLLADRVPYPLHIGVTEAGTSLSGTVKSSVGLGILLAEGIGDTLRVSLTADPVEEVRVGWEILAALDIRRNAPELVSCPTCGRCEVDLIPIAEEIARRLRTRRTPVKVAVMGCVVNGPGEAREADIGVAAGKGVGLLFAKGEPLRKVPEEPRSSRRSWPRSTASRPNSAPDLAFSSADFAICERRALTARLCSSTAQSSTSLRRSPPRRAACGAFDPPLADTSPRATAPTRLPSHQ